MLIKNKLSKEYENFIKAKCFISKIETPDKVVTTFVEADLKKSKSLIDTNRFEKKSKKLLLELLNSTKIDSKVSKFVNLITFKDLQTIDTIIEKCLDDLKSEFDSISTNIVQALNKEYPFPDHYVEETKDEIKIIISSKVSLSLYKKKKIVNLEFKDFNYSKQISDYTDFIEKIVDERIKSITITIPTSKIIVQGTGTATNSQPIILSNATSILTPVIS